ncbi:MAG: hypothetical protein IKU68_04815 [Oscillospiraceae bacterium]|nr:hypothetical protein [Oscillospiraceae bacterium]
MDVKRMLACVLSIAALTMVLSGCGGQEETVTTEVPTVDTEATEAAKVTEATAATAPTEEEMIDPNLILVNTVYGKIYYQEQWAEFMKVEQISDNDNLNVRFVAEFNGANYPLFTLVIGTGEGDAAGTLTDADGVQRDVFVQIEESVEYDGLSNEEQDRLYAMQEEINFVMQNLK